MQRKEQEFLLKIGSNIDYHRKESGLTLQALADLIDMEKSNLIRIIKARTNVTTLTLYRLSVALKIDAKQLLED